MKKIKHLVIKITLCSYFLFCSTFTVNLFSQTPVVQSKFEEIFIHTDNSTYAPGDSTWFKAYILDDN